MAETERIEPDPSRKEIRRGKQGSIGRPIAIGFVGIYQVVLSVLLVYLLFALWPEVVRDADGNVSWAEGARVFGNEMVLTQDARLILIVLAAGALGSYVHASTSFVSYVGNRRLRLSWVWWYMLRPFIGLALALIFYFVIRGGLLSTSADSAEMSAFGVAAVAGLVGMFSKQATDKLRELFDTLFRTQTGGDEARADKLEDHLPVTDAMVPRQKIVGRELDEGQTDADVKVIDLHARLAGIVTRIPVFTRDGAVKYVIHQSILFKFLADKGIESAKSGTPFEASNFTLEDLVAHENVRKLVKDALAFVPQNASVSEAREAMKEVEHCQDVFVTEHGIAAEPVKGWLTNAELVRHGRD